MLENNTHFPHQHRNFCATNNFHLFFECFKKLVIFGGFLMFFLRFLKNKKNHRYITVTPLHRYKRYAGPLGLVFKQEKVVLSEVAIADVRKCRRNALAKSSHPIPVFGPLDDIRARVEPVLGDLNFVAAPYVSFVKQMGYTGPGWQHRVQTEFLLHMGVIA
jgi:hypothetical protein